MNQRIKDRLTDLGYVVLAASITLLVVIGMVWATIEFQRFVDKFCGQ